MHTTDGVSFAAMSWSLIAETVPSPLALVSELVSPFTTREIVNAALLLASEDCTLMTPF